MLAIYALASRLDVRMCEHSGTTSQRLQCGPKLVRCVRMNGYTVAVKLSARNDWRAARIGVTPCRLRSVKWSGRICHRFAQRKCVASRSCLEVIRAEVEALFRELESAGLTPVRVNVGCPGSGQNTYSSLIHLTNAADSHCMKRSERGATAWSSPVIEDQRNSERLPV